MSYILEALKKAQAERQLGSAPTIHAMSIQPVADGPAGASRAPWIVAGALILGAAGVAAAVFWPRPAPPSVPAVALVTAAPSVAAPPAVAAPAAPVPMASAALPQPLPAPVAAPVPAAPRVPPAPARAAEPKLPVAAPPVPKPVPAPIQEAPRVVQAAAPVEAPEESYPLLRELPEALQRDVPRVAIGGYIYSKNPADRLLLVDKILRREGEDVGSGQILEKLQSKAAVMNYRGTRYRIPY